MLSDSNMNLLKVLLLIHQQQKELFILTMLKLEKEQLTM